MQTKLNKITHTGNTTIKEENKKLINNLSVLFMWNNARMMTMKHGRDRESLQ